MILCHSQIETVGDLTQSLPLPLKGEGLDIARLGFAGFALLVHNRATVAQQGWGFGGVRFPTLSSNRPYIAVQSRVWFSCFWCVLGVLTGIFSHPFFKTRFGKPYSLVTSTAIFEVTSPQILGKQKAGISSSLCIKIQFSTSFWSNRIRIRPVCHPPLPAWRYHQS